MNNILVLVAVLAVFYFLMQRGGMSYLNSLNTNNVLVIVVVVGVLYFLMQRREAFSLSGLNMSDSDCNKLHNTYWNPQETNESVRADHHKRVCGAQRLKTIDFDSSNYFTENGQLM